MQRQRRRQRAGRRTAPRVRRAAVDRRRHRTPATCRFRAASSRAFTSPWSSCRSRTRSTRATRSPGHDSGHRQARDRDRRRRHRQRLHRHVEPARLRERDPVRAVAAAARRGPVSPRRASGRPTRPGPIGRSSSAPAPRTRKAAIGTGASRPRNSWATTHGQRARACVTVSIEWYQGRAGAAAFSEVPGTEKSGPANWCCWRWAFSGPRRKGAIEQLGSGARSARQREVRRRVHVERRRACSPPATCAAASRWSCGPSTKDAKPPGPSTST